MTQPPVSVVIVSRDRPAALHRCLQAVSQLQYSSFEVVVVSDEAGAKMLEAHPVAKDIKHARCNEANISVARNIGIKLAGGDIVAFVDDDAVPEPSWLTELVKPFATHGYAGGPVRGRNGISWQWQARMVNRLGQTRPHDPGTLLPDGWCLKTEGTNMAVRRDVLAAVGGFDPAFRFFLDETDLNLRLWLGGHTGAFASSAEVHHGFLPSSMRRRDRVPSDLFEIGASWAVYLGKHSPASGIAARLAEIREDEFRRLDRHLQSGALEPRDVRRLMKRLDAGIAEGRTRGTQPVPDFDNPPAFRAFPVRFRPGPVLTCRPLTLGKIRAEALDRVKRGEIVTVINLSSSALFHHVEFTKDGIWEQHGGIFGKSVRSQPLFRFWSRSARISAETGRVAKQRQIS